MTEQKGASKPELKELPQIKDRMSFLYLEKCEVCRDSSAIKLSDISGSVCIPAASLSVILLGPGTTITHRALELIGDTGICVAWVGENGVRFYAGGRPLTTSSRMLIRQAEFISNQRKHYEVVRKMYSLRFPEEDLNGLTLQQMRGKEGVRMKQIYQKMSETYNVPWNGRHYDVENFSDGDPVNQALSAANSCLYGLVHSIVCALGLSPGLGFIHVGHEKSFIYDIADLYKAEISIPAAFEAAAFHQTQAATYVRRILRDRMFQSHLVERIVYDLLYMFQEKDEEIKYPEISLWNNRKGEVQSGKSYAEREA